MSDQLCGTGDRDRIEGALIDMEVLWNEYVHDESGFRVGGDETWWRERECCGTNHAIQ